MGEEAGTSAYVTTIMVYVWGYPERNVPSIHFYVPLITDA